MIAWYVWRDLLRNPRRTLTTVAGMALGVGLFSAVLFFVDGSSASLTARAVAPLPLDMQRILADPLNNSLRLTERITPDRLAAGDRARVELTVANRSPRPANEVVVRDDPPEPLRYVAGSTRVDGKPMPDFGDNPLASGEAKVGLNLGTLAPRTTERIEFQVVADAAVESVATLGPQSTFVTREIVVPVKANTSVPVTLTDLTRRVARVPGVARADALSMVDLSPGSLSTASKRSDAAVRVFGFDETYRTADPAIRIVEGSYEAGHGLLSAEAARDLAVRPGGSVEVHLPGRRAPLVVPISGITDLTRAKSLFYSREGKELEQFVYVPHSVVVPPELFADTVVPAFQSASTTPGVVLRSRPILEVDVWVERELLDADPGTALGQTKAIAERINAIAAGQDDLIDNISNALEVAREDAAVAKRMFVFLGLPGALLAAILTAYAGSVLAGALRREQALLRIRGADRRQLLRMHALRTLILAAVGSVLGVGLGLVSTVVVLGSDALLRASPLSLAASALLSAGCGFVGTGAALYLSGRQAITREIAAERAQLVSRVPLWRRLWLDVLVLAVVAGVELYARRTGAFEGTSGSVYYGRSVSLRLHLVVVPIGIWLGGVLLLARLVERGFAHLPLSRGGRFGGVVRGLLTRSVRRRSWASAGAVIMIGLIVALGTSAEAFSASYLRAKTADARFTVGSDLRVTPAPTSKQQHPPAYAQRLRVAGVDTATPVVYGLLNALVESERNEDAANLVAVDPVGFGKVAPLTEATFVGQSAAAAMETLRRHPRGAYVGVELADLLDVERGDEIKVLFERGTKQQKLTTLTVVGLFDRLPGFPEGANLMVNLSRHVQVIPSTNADFFLARTTDATDATLARTVTALREGPGATDALQIDTRNTALDKDQSSLAALNIRSLLALDQAYALAMAATAITIFVFGLLLQRRREYVTLRAQGMRAEQVRSLLVIESVGTVAIGSLAGFLVGAGMAYFLVAVLRPLFILRPAVVLPGVGLAVLTALVLAVSLLASLAATTVVNRLPPGELLRDE